MNHTHGGTCGRRRFIQTATGAASAILTLPCGTTAFADDNASGTVTYHPGYLPVLYAADVIIPGGSCAAISAAVELANAGKRVILIESRSYPGREITAALRPWLDIDGPGALPRVITAILDRNGSTSRNGAVPLRMDAVKLALEDQLLDAGVKLLYASTVIDILSSPDGITGVVIGNKSGRQVITGQTVIDATETALAARIAGCRFDTSSRGRHVFRRTLEFTGAGTIKPGSLPVPGDLNLDTNRVTVRSGYRGGGHVLVEFGLGDLPEGFSADDVHRRESEARHRSMRLVSHLVTNEPAFNGAFFAVSSHMLHGPGCHQLADTAPSTRHTPPDGTVTVRHPSEGKQTIPLDAFATDVPGLWCLQEAARIDSGWETWFSGPVTSSLIGSAFARTVAPLLPESVSPSLSQQRPAAEQPRPYSFHRRISEPDSPEAGRYYPGQAVGAQTVPVLDSVDVLVVGGGTSGATAAITAATGGVSAHVVDMNPVLGGTGTIGGVDSYWFGRKAGFNRRIARLVDDVHGMIGYAGEKWNIEAKMYALLRETERAGAGITLNAPVIGAVTDGSVVRGAVFATSWGPRAVHAKVTIDATGDGDVAVFAGAESVYGTESTGIPMWYSLAQFTEPGKTQNNFTGPVSIGNIEDYTRAILAGRRRGGELHDHGAYVASRETRHITGDYRLTLTDILRCRRWPDVVNVVFSNYDIKGIVDSDWLRMGYLPPNLEIEIPYRILLPRGLDGILVAGKAISATHDALPPIRMQADLENLGGVVAVAALLAVKSGCPPRKIDISALQHRLVEHGVLPPECPGRKIDPPRYTSRELTGFLDRVIAGRPFHLSGEMEMDELERPPLPLVTLLTSGDDGLAVLTDAFETADGDARVRIARMLAMYGSPLGVPLLIKTIMDSFKGGVLPVRTSDIKYVQLPPDHGAMPQVVYLMYSLGMTADTRSIPVWNKVAELINPAEESFREMEPGTHYYVEAVCYGTERLGTSDALPALRKLHSFPALNGYVVRSGIEPDYFLERRAILELGIARAMARCGDPGGLAILTGYLDDSRRTLAGYAHRQLKAITETDIGKSSALWNDWLDRSRSSWGPRPLLGRQDT